MSLFIKCPHCNSKLQFNDSHASCDNKHYFDLSKDNYLNLHLNQSNIKLSGDTPVSLNARQAFLNTGYYNLLKQSIVEQAQSFGSQNLVDIGCGEGYYTAGLHEGLAVKNKENAYTSYGIDISKYAIKKAAKQYKQINWIVASANQLPFYDEQVDLVTSIFSPIYSTELMRVLSPKGKIIIVKPNSAHLLSFRQELFEKGISESDHTPLKNTEFKLIDSKTITIELELNPLAIQQLLQMTPYGWKANLKQQQNLLEKEIFNTIAQFDITTYQKQ